MSVCASSGIVANSFEKSEVFQKRNCSPVSNMRDEPSGLQATTDALPFNSATCVPSDVSKMIVPSLVASATRSPAGLKRTE